MKFLRIPLSKSLFMDFCYIPAGRFLMGMDYDESDSLSNIDESPQHIKNLSEYLIGKYPVTNKQYLLFTQQTGYKYPIHLVDGIIPEGKENHPVVNVSLMDVHYFCKWMCETTNYFIFVPGEAQWEKSARGENGKLYPWGNSDPDDSMLNYRNTIQDTTSVDQFPKGCSCYGACDMAGNVWEWTESPFVGYRGDKFNPSYFLGDKHYVIRGGSWASRDCDVRCANREGKFYADRENNLGFRCACSTSIKPNNNSSIIRFVDM